MDVGSTSKVIIIAVLFIFHFGFALCEDDSGEVNVRKERRGRFFNVFQVITFPNGPCMGSGNMNGTCYTEQECESRGGANGGSCASGFGVCCIISVSCGQSSSENCTYFDSTGLADADDGCCIAEICPCGDHICQLRLDFDNFQITGPSTSMLSVAERNPEGTDVTAKAAGLALSEFGQCLTDTFSVTNPNGPNPPTICGFNSGEHMYVESGECCNKLSFTLGQTGVGVALANRAWSIKITQYSCKFPNLAPQGCTQYFFDGTYDQVQTFNYNNGNGVHLASQDQTICVRRERNFCRICWTAEAVTDFALTGSTKSSLDANPNACCDYGGATAAVLRGFDCIQIPFAAKNTFLPTNSHICGNNKGLNQATTCSTRTPFALHFRSDKWETFKEASIGGQLRNSGFRLVYFMDNKGCNSASIVTP